MPATNIVDKNSFCELLDIRYPICQAGMYQVPMADWRRPFLKLAAWGLSARHL